MIEKFSQATVWSQSNMRSLTDVDNVPLTRLPVDGTIMIIVLYLFHFDVKFSKKFLLAVSFT